MMARVISIAIERGLTSPERGQRCLNDFVVAEGRTPGHCDITNISVTGTYQPLNPRTREPEGPECSIYS